MQLLSHFTIEMNTLQKSSFVFIVLTFTVFAVDGNTRVKRQGAPQQDCVTLEGRPGSCTAAVPIFGGISCPNLGNRTAAKCSNWGTICCPFDDKPASVPKRPARKF